MTKYIVARSGDYFMDELGEFDRWRESDEPFTVTLFPSVESAIGTWSSCREVAFEDLDLREVNADLDGRRVVLTAGQRSVAMGEAEEYQRYLELKEKFEGHKECTFAIYWHGDCKKDTINGLFCEDHALSRCHCGQQAVRDCGTTEFAFVCGAPLCADHGCVRHGTSYVISV